MSVSSSVQLAPDVSAADVIAEAVAVASRLGHDLHGFLSRSHGFLPVAPPLRALPVSHRAWDEAAALLPQLNGAQRFCEVLGALPVLSADAASFDDGYAWRAVLLLGYFAHAYVNFASDKAALPAAIVAP